MQSSLNAFGGEIAITPASSRLLFIYELARPSAAKAALIEQSARFSRSQRQC